MKTIYQILEAKVRRGELDEKGLEKFALLYKEAVICQDGFLEIDDGPEGNSIYYELTINNVGRPPFLDFSALLDKPISVKGNVPVTGNLQVQLIESIGIVSRSSKAIMTYEFDDQGKVQIKTTTHNLPPPYTERLATYNGPTRTLVQAVNHLMKLYAGPPLDTL